MSYYTGRLTISSSGINTFTVGFAPTWARFRVSQKVGTVETTNHLSLGGTDGTRQNCSSFFTDGSGNTCFDTNTKVVSHYERVGGTVTEVLAATFDSFTATGVKVNASIPNASYQVTLECGN